MHNDFESYIDSFNHITIIIRKNLCFKEKNFFLNFDDAQIPLEAQFMMEIGDNNKYEVLLPFELELHKEYIIVDEYDNISYLESGKVVRLKEFDDKYYCDKPLGVIYSKEGSIFRLWTPVAKEVILELTDQKNVQSSYPLEYIDKGLWEIMLDGDFELYRYRYLVRLGINFYTVADPYAYSSSSNGHYNYIIDFDKVIGYDFEIPKFSGVATDAVIYEASVRDFSFSKTSGALHKGKFLGMLENHPTKVGLATGISYLKQLGITHLQLMPVFDFGGVDDNSDEKYDWGYNPEQYFIPCGWYSNYPDKPYERINEFRKLVDGASANNIRVVMDVVFNHVYDMKDFAFEKVVPGYFYRVDENGIITNYSGCSNDLATEKKMCRKFILDVIRHWITFYNIRGFRFDLMGLIDIDTMQSIANFIKEYDETIIMYGEGWKIPNTLPDNKRAHMFNYEKLKDYAFFNDYFRDYIRGSQYDKSLGFAFGTPRNDDLFYLLTGSCIDGFMFDEPTSSLNYVECHDNYTFIDFSKSVTEISDFEKKDYSALAMSVVILSQGIPFLTQGQEFLRSKDMNENSYNSGDKINEIDFVQRDLNIELVDMVKDLIKIRMKYPDFRYSNRKDIIINIKDVTEENLSARFMYRNIKYNLILVVKNTYEEEIFEVKNFGMIFDSRKELLIPIYGKGVLDKPGVYIFKENKDV